MKVDVKVLKMVGLSDVLKVDYSAVLLACQKVAKSVDEMVERLVF